MSTIVKKLFLGLCSFVGIVAISQTFAADNNILNALQGDNATWTTSIVATWPTTTGIMIQFPVFSTNGEKIMNYAISYVKDKSIAGANISDIKKVTFEGDKVKVNNDKVTLILDWLTADSTYNFVVSPINKEGNELELSDEFTFKTLAVNATNNTPDPTTMLNEWGNTDTMLWAADTASALLTYVLNDNKVTVTWKTISGASKFNFSTKEATQSVYTNLGSVDVSKEQYEFTITKKGLHTVKIVPVDNAGKTVGVEKTLSIKIDTIATPEKGKGTPATGAGLNLILMSTFLMMLMYVVYRFRTTK
jgi:hypothetical protein